MILLALLAVNATVNILWIIGGGIGVALGAAIWKLIPRVVKWSLEEVIEQTVTPQLDRVNDRIDSHMNTEESSFDDLQIDVGKIATVLDERTQLFNHVDDTLRETQTVIAKHMTEDTVQFAQAGAALAEGQRALLDRLATVDDIAERIKRLERKDKKKTKKKR